MRGGMVTVRAVDVAGFDRPMDFAANQELGVSESDPRHTVIHQLNDLRFAFCAQRLDYTAPADEVADMADGPLQLCWYCFPRDGHDY